MELEPINPDEAAKELKKLAQAEPGKSKSSLALKIAAVVFLVAAGFVAGRMTASKGKEPVATPQTVQVKREPPPAAQPTVDEQEVTMTKKELQDIAAKPGPYGPRGLQFNTCADGIKACGVPSGGVIVQILSKNSFIYDSAPNCVDTNLVGRCWCLIDGLPTDGLVDGQGCSGDPHTPVKVVGTIKYTTVNGATKTIYHAKRIRVIE